MEDRIPYVYAEFGDDSIYQVSKASEEAAQAEVKRLGADPACRLAYVRYDAPGNTMFGDKAKSGADYSNFETTGTLTPTAEGEAHLTEFFKSAAVEPGLKTSFDEMPAGEETWLDNFRLAAENASDHYHALKDPYTWSRTWRRVAMLTFPFAFVVWLLTLAVLLFFAVAFDLIVRIYQWADMSFTSFDDWWNRPDEDVQSVYHIKMAGTHFDNMNATGTRMK